MHRLTAPVLIVILALLAAPAHASLIFVNTADDELNTDNDCSLREAIEAANTNTPVDGCTGGQSIQTDAIFLVVSDEIVLDAGLGPLVITDRVNLVGAGRDTTIISQQSTIQLFVVEMVNTSHDVEFSQMTLRDGHAVPGLYGGAVQLMEGDSFIFRDVAFVDNTVVGATTESWAGGGAIFAGPLLNSPDPTLLIEDCLFRGNTAVREFGTLDRGLGGAILSLWRAEAGGSGTANEALDALTIIDSEFRENSSEKSGLAVFTRFVPQVTIEGSQFIGNQNLTVGVSTETGAVTVQGSGSDLLFIRDSTFVDNMSRDNGSAVYASGLAGAVTNSTFTGNMPAPLRLNGGATLSVQYSTLVNNNDTLAFKPVIDVCADCDFSSRASIIWNAWPTDNLCSVEPGGAYTSLGFNIDSDGSCTGHASDLPMTDPKLLTLDAWGGAAANFDLLTFLPVPGGAAVDGAGLDTCPGPLGGNVTTDARGQLRPVDGSETGSDLCDIGAVEYQFEQDPEAATLHVQIAGNGAGQVTSNPQGVDCTADCEADFLARTNVRLTASPAVGSTFAGWTGACTGTGLCQVILNQNAQVTATFTGSAPDLIFKDGFD